MIVIPPRLDVIVVDMTVSSDNLHVSISVQGNDLANVLINGTIPRSTFTSYLSGSILSVVAAYGPWSAGYGLPPLSLQTATPSLFSKLKLRTLSCQFVYLQAF